MRWTLEKKDSDRPDKFFVRLVCGKARVTPIKGITVPRSELSGFLILTRLLKVVVDSMDIKPSKIVTAVDSECTISAMEKTGGALAPYFASRVSEASNNLASLAETTEVLPIQHVPGLLNPADIATRDTSLPQDVAEQSTWQSGPSYLALPMEHWPFSRNFLDRIPDQELRSPKAIFNMVDSRPWISRLGTDIDRMVNQIMERSSCYQKTTCVTARLLKCLFSRDKERIKEPLTAQDLKVARLVQFIISMGPTLQAWDAGKLDSLRPYQQNGIIYMRGRNEKALTHMLGVSGLPILVRNCSLAYLIMWESHNENHRASHTDVLARSRQRAWILKGRFLAKEVCKYCPKCKLIRKKMVSQLMSDIPDHQLHPCPPFTHVSIDLAGPFRAKAMGNSRTYIKLWGLVVVCQNTRAVKMYATSGYSTDDFLTAYHRFTSNHGNPSLVVSDAGSQVKRAGKVIEQGDPAGLNWIRIQEDAAKSGTEWRLVEPGCQWRNGLAEAAVKLVKSTLSLTLASQSTLNYAELDTLFSSISNIVNQRPIAVRDFTEDDIHAITPNDLLLQRTKNTIPGIQYSSNDSVTKRQETMREIEQLWWDQWVVQALPHLVPFKKWKTEHRDVQPRDIVLVLYENKVSKGDFGLARVLRVQKDSHGRVRTVVVGMRGKDRAERLLPYVPKPLQELRIGIQRLAVICPAEEQDLPEETKEQPVSESN